VFAAARDVTEAKHVEAELLQTKGAAESASRIKSDFLASMSHEIRTPMNAIIGISDLLAKTALSPLQDRYVQTLERSRMSLIRFSRLLPARRNMEASQLVLEQTGFSLNDHIEKVMEMVAARAEEKGLVLAREIAPNVPNDLIGDSTRLRQVLLNLLSNAINFTEAGGVTLQVASDMNADAPTALRFTVSDTGIGISETQLRRVFERFTQADSSTTRRFGGSGLGLTISKQLVELMGGRIWVESKLGQGSAFSFAVPLETWANANRSTGATGPAFAEPVLPPLHILLAEDSPDNCTITIAYLLEPSTRSKSPRTAPSPSTSLRPSLTTSY
jgi:signal transduction histidine kinase